MSGPHSSSQRTSYGKSVAAATLLASALVVSSLLGPAAPAGTRRGPTFHRDVLPILQENCQTCHRPGDIAPFPLMAYADASIRAGLISDEVISRRMPPWKPVPGHGVFRDERRLSDEQIDVIRRWAEAGAPEGNPNHAPSPREFAEGWSLGTPDLVLTPGETYTVEGNTDDYRCFPVATDFTTDRWVRAVDILPGNREVVHHVILYIDPTGASHDRDAQEEGPGYTCFGGADVEVSGALGGWAPGYRPFTLDDDIGIRLPAGATVVMQVHYHPHAGPSGTDLTSAGIYFHDTPPAREMLIVPLGETEFLIPAGDASHRITTSWDAPPFIGATVHTLAPHMHLIGKSMTVTADFPDGSARTLVRIDDWDFRWQAAYSPMERIALPPGTRVTLDATFDNSAANPRNPSSPPVPVTYGESTTDEMCFCFLGVSLGIQQAPPPAPAISGVKVDRRGRIRVKATGFAPGARIEVDGIALADTAGRRSLRSKIRGAVPVGTPVNIAVRNPDGLRSPTVPVERLR